MEVQTETTSLAKLNENQAARLAELFRAMSDASRVLIIAALLDGPMHVQSLAQVAGISESGASHHLRSLRQMRVVSSRRQGQRVYYSIHDEHIADLFRRGVEHILHG
jgi:ArsR family transcriptional regulator